MSEQLEALLRRGGSDEFVGARLSVGVDEAMATRADDSWSTFIALRRAEQVANGEPIKYLENEHWQWREKVRATKSYLSYLTIAIECESDVQGLIMLLTDGHFAKLKPQKGLPLVYVPFVSAAPWNQTAVTSSPRFVGVGTLLLRVAVQVSHDLEFKGRLGLHSLPQAEEFYVRCGMIDLGIDPSKNGLKYFEMTADIADELTR